MNPLSRLLRRFKKRRVKFGLRVPDVEQSTLPSRPTKLLVRIKTEFGPRTFVTGSVTRLTASVIVDVLAGAGIEAAFVDSEFEATVAEIVKRRKPREILSLPSMEKRR